MKKIQGSEFPERFKKEGCLYCNGVITSASRGYYFVELDNGMEAILTSRKLEKLRVSLLPGDEVVAEIPTAGFESNATRLRGRVCWRFRK